MSRKTCFGNKMLFPLHAYIPLLHQSGYSDSEISISGSLTAGLDPASTLQKDVLMRTMFYQKTPPSRSRQIAFLRPFQKFGRTWKVAVLNAVDRDLAAALQCYLMINPSLTRVDDRVDRFSKDGRRFSIKIGRPIPQHCPLRKGCCRGRLPFPLLILHKAVRRKCWGVRRTADRAFQRLLNPPTQIEVDSWIPRLRSAGPQGGGCNKNNWCRKVPLTPEFGMNDEDIAVAHYIMALVIYKSGLKTSRARFAPLTLRQMA